MSLLLHRRAIERAIAGELTVAAEQKLRAHLRACAACRAHYDDLVRASEALALFAGRSDGGQAALDRERARLVAALGVAEDGGGRAASDRDAWTSAAAAPSTGRFLRPAWVATLLVPAALAIWFFARPAVGPTSVVSERSGVTWRGGSSDEAAPLTDPVAHPVADPPADPPAALLIFASRKEKTSASSRTPDVAVADRAVADSGAHVRLVAEFPASGEARVSRRDRIQFVLRGLQTSAFVTVVGVDDAGEAHIYVPRPGTAPRRLEPSASATTLGPSIDLAAGHRVGRLRLYALFSRGPIDAAHLRAAVGRLDRSRPGAPALDLSVPQAAGVLMIGP